MDLQITTDATPEEARAELARWLDSGEYRQTRSTLCYRDGNGAESYCCLGVASEIGVALGTVTKAVRKVGGGLMAAFVVSYDGESSVLPVPLRGFFGMNSTGELIGKSAVKYMETAPELDFTPELTGYNDRQRADFHTIATVVRNGEFKAPLL